jgi:hypothetical protein
MKIVSIVLLLVLVLCCLAEEKNYTVDVLKLKALIEDEAGDYHHKAYDRLAYFTDMFGPRLWGSRALYEVIYELYSMAVKEGFDNVRLEAVKNFTRW